MLLYYCLPVYIHIPKTMELTMMIKIPVGKPVKMQYIQNFS